MTLPRSGNVTVIELELDLKSVSYEGVNKYGGFDRTKKAFKTNDFEGFLLSSDPAGTKLELFDGRFEIIV